MLVTHESGGSMRRRRPWGSRCHAYEEVGFDKVYQMNVKHGDVVVPLQEKFQHFKSGNAAFSSNKMPLW